MRIDKNKCIYTAIFLDLDSETKERVTSLFKRDLPKKFLHHMTIEFRPTTKRAKPVVDQTGCETFVKVIGYEETDKIQVLVVEHGLGTVKGKPLVTSKVPHVTVATNANTSPVYANEVLEDGWTPLDEPIYLTGYIGAFPHYENDLILSRLASTLAFISLVKEHGGLRPYFCPTTDFGKRDSKYPDIIFVSCNDGTMITWDKYHLETVRIDEDKTRHVRQLDFSLRALHTTEYMEHGYKEKFGSY